MTVFTKKLNWQYKDKASSPKDKIPSQHLPEKTEKNYENFSQYNWSTG
jgi:hypothetical protein